MTGRDSRGHFIKGNVPWNKRVDIKGGQCVHHWIIDRDNVGRCIKCGAAKDFGKLLGMAKKELNHWQPSMDGLDKVI